MLLLQPLTNILAKLKFLMIAGCTIGLFGSYKIDIPAQFFHLRSPIPYSSGLRFSRCGSVVTQFHRSSLLQPLYQKSQYEVEQYWLTPALSGAIVQIKDDNFAFFCRGIETICREL